MSDVGVQDDSKVDFLTAEAGLGPEAVNFRIEQPAGASSSEPPKFNMSPVRNSPSNTDARSLTGVRKELENLGSEKGKKSGKTVLIFGQGPVITEPEERVNFWSKDLAEAAAELEKHDPKIKSIVVMGGPTGGKSNSSEAHMIAGEMRRHGVDQEAIRLEELSNDTIENIVNFLNIIDEDPSAIKQRFDILTAPYHSHRTQVLMQLFKVPLGHVFHSTEVLRYAARDPQDQELPTQDSSKWDHQKLQAIEDKININDPTKYSAKQSHSSEQRDVADRYIKDNLWTRELIEHPEKWLPYVGRLSDGERITAVLAQFENLYPGLLEEKYNILIPENIDDATLAHVKMQLAAIPEYKGLTGDTVSQWVNENKSQSWPESTNAKLEKLLEMRE